MIVKQNNSSENIENYQREAFKKYSELTLLRYYIYNVCEYTKQNLIRGEI